MVIKCLLITLAMNPQMCRAGTDRIPLATGAMLEFSESLTPKEQKSFGSGWKTATYIGARGNKFNIFPLEALTPEGGVIFGDSSLLRISPTGKYVVIDTIRAGIADPGPSGKPGVQSRQYCPVLEAKTGCIVSNQSGELCEGQWEKKDDRWVVPGLTDDESSEMLKHQFSDANTLWKGYVKSAGKLFRPTIKEMISSNFGVDNLMACDRPSLSNVASYENIAAELKRTGGAVDSEYIVKTIKGMIGQGGGSVAQKNRK